MGSFYVVFLVGLLLLQSCVVNLAISPSNFTDLSALLAFKSEIKLDPNNVLGSNWTKTENFCNWVGVSCSRRRQRVVVLSLGDMGLQGTISPHVGNLSFLVGLVLSNNSFHGHLVPEIGRLHRLRALIVERNKLEGEIPASIQHCQKLKIISLNSNEFTGVIPAWLSNFSSLGTLFLGENNFTGTIPASLGNISKLEWLGLGENNLHGIIPDEIGNLNLQAIALNQNHLTGSIPPSIFNISSLTQIVFSYNSLSGTLPSSLGLWLPNLQQLLIEANQLHGNIPLYLSNCSQLTELILTSNQFTGPVPTSLGRLEHLQTLILAGNHLTGPIPKEIGSLRNLNLLYLADNNLIGSIPSTIKGMKSLQRLFLGGNQLEQIIPSEICLLSNLGEMDLGYNNLSGSIPSCIGNLRYLQSMILSSNSLSSSIPSSLWSLQNLLFLDFSFNSLSGSLDANMRALKMLETMDLSWNKISGNIPTIFGGFQSLRSLNLSRNSFWGPIPESLGEMITLDYMDLSHNNLSGLIPKSLVALSNLHYLNLSFNKLSGEIPSEGPFGNFTATSFMENEALCGQKIFQVPPCRSHDTQKSKTMFLLKVILPVIASVSILIALILIVIKYRKRNVTALNSIDVLPSVEHRMISYHELRRATNDFSEANILGVGSFGSVFKGVLFDGTNVAVKVLNLQIEGAFKSFDAECEVLVRVRHRNLVKVISSCSNPDLRALVLQYMPNGSLEKWLYSHNYCLNLFQRVSIMVDVALALEYLHHGQSEPVVHCDLKPSNVLLDGEMIAHVGDFGIAKILVENKTATQTKTLGTLGYIAPEYGSEGRVSTRGDIYSYGVMLLEMFTRKKPTDVMFVGELSLRQWVMTSIPDKIMEVIDANLLSIEDGRDVIAAQGDLFAIMELGLECSREFPEERVDIKEVVVKLNKIKLKLF
ncbi:probable LRR receptor-like serine/threonine-protein kinase At3g47570 isoform X1 [Vitis riparia]|uniref:probable LRR receptor-like serine/threonine-protein kinase At3g47570 isoform X1 n=1 Tax=Vitis riparia TaxID=96939 RepID=UPI00155A5F42|nr:probable LRR receptor-like serine/threonine-protein kinase At3g47570 isoform X1 [Vitis riparia]XP_034699097.1 probable LRR receptor-like serine/threonine-protein kinase At3g47570 isoform X1 [Vitis riparia]